MAARVSGNSHPPAVCAWGTRSILAAVSPSMLRLCCTKSSWLQGLWKKADSHVSFQMRECSWRHRSSGVLQTGA